MRDRFASDSAAHTPSLVTIDTLLGLNDSQLNPEFQEAREAIPLALFDFLVERKDAGQMINVDNIKNMPTINELQTRCNPIYFIKQEGHGRYGFLENIQDEDIVDTNEPDT